MASMLFLIVRTILSYVRNYMHLYLKQEIICIQHFKKAILRSESNLFLER